MEWTENSYNVSKRDERRVYRQLGKPHRDVYLHFLIAYSSVSISFEKICTAAFSTAQQYLFVLLNFKKKKPLVSFMLLCLQQIITNVYKLQCVQRGNAIREYCSIYWIVSIKKSFLFLLLLLFIWSLSVHCSLFFLFPILTLSIFVKWNEKLFFFLFYFFFCSLSCLNCFSSGLFIQSLSGRMHLRGRWCAPFKRNTNGKTTLRRAGGGWPDAQVLDLALDMHCLKSLHFYLSLVFFFISYCWIWTFFFYNGQKREKERCKKTGWSSGIRMGKRCSK